MGWRIDFGVLLQVITIQLQNDGLSSRNSVYLATQSTRCKLIRRDRQFNCSCSNVHLGFSGLLLNFTKAT
jgi:hypothetical protein